MSKTTKYILFGLGAVAVIYLVAAPRSPIKLGSSSGTTTSGVASVIDASGRFLGAAGDFIDGIMGDDEEGEED